MTALFQHLPGLPGLLCVGVASAAFGLLPRRFTGSGRHRHHGDGDG